MMNFNEFVTEIKGLVQERLNVGDTNTEVTIHEVSKNNDTILTALTPRKTGAAIAPTIYLDSFYEAYCSGANFDELVDRIVSLSQKPTPEGTGLVVDNIRSYDKIKEFIFTRVINAGRNSEFLKAHPHKMFMDLAITYCVIVPLDGEGSGAIKITNEMFNAWGVTLDELDKTARENDMNKSGYRLQNISVIIRKMLIQDGMPEALVDEYIARHMPADEMPMRVLINSDASYSANGIIHNELLAKCAEEIGNDLYIIPSSVHELIIMPYEEEHSVGEYTEMISSVNSSMLSEEEYLSDNLYFYSRLNNEVLIA